MQTDDLSRLWQTEQDILDEIHSVCVQNGIRYSLAFGTLIGAIRHQGFIPWDDDIDIMMPREEYERFVRVWEQSEHDDFLLQRYDTTPDIPNNFSKVRKNHTAFIQTEQEKHVLYHKGVFVDIFPFDAVAGGWLSRKLQLAACSVSLLYSRGYCSGKGGLSGFVERALLLAPKSKYRALQLRMEKSAFRWKDHSNGWFSACTYNACRIVFPADLFDEIIEISFNGKKYYAVKNADTFLRIQYGDYMQLPPEEERVLKHHPLLVDFEHNYEELIDRE